MKIEVDREVLDRAISFLEKRQDKASAEWMSMAQSALCFSDSHRKLVDEFEGIIKELYAAAGYNDKESDND